MTCRGRAATRLFTAAIALLLPVVAAPAAEPPWQECRVPGLRVAVRCGQVSRPLDPARPDGPRIDVHYVVVPAIARRAHPDPVFVIAGGPGQSAIRLAGPLVGMLERLGQRRDIVLVDQRGTGRSAPLDCDEPRHQPLADATDPARAPARALRCRQALQALPHVAGPEGLRHYTTPLAAQDLDAVREALGAPRINLVAMSYGTRVALELLRQFPTRVRRGVLDGVVPPDMQLPVAFGADGAAAFEALLAACEAADGCSAAYPTLRADWAFLLASLPREVTLPHPLGGRPERLLLTREMLFGVLRGPLYSPALAAGLPGAIAEAAQGRPLALFGLAAQLGAGEAARLSAGMHYSVVCSEDMPAARGREAPAEAASPGRTDAAPAADFGSTALRLYERVCADWPRGTLPPAFFHVPRSDAPMLLLSGGIDPATPPRHGARVAQALGPNARHVVVPNGGHGLLALPCLRDAAQRFIDAPDDAAALAIDTGCAARVPRPPAFRPVDPFAPTPG